MIRNGLFSSESVSDGHPDKLADRISDRILDAFLSRDASARVACETMLADQCVIVTGEFRTARSDDFEAVRAQADALVREVLSDTGYRSATTGIDPARCEVQVRFNRQSADIARGVDRADQMLGAGDQGLMFGYACDDTPERMPLPIALAHRLMQRHRALRDAGAIPWLQPDAKSQVTCRLVDSRPVSVETVVLSTQHDETVDAATVAEVVERDIVRHVLAGLPLGEHFRVLVNPTGRFVTGGPKGDTGLTGRKIIVDTYGGACPHGGGAFSGKDPSKVDRSAAYAARQIARTVVDRDWARRALVQVAYAIGVAAPVSFSVETFGTEQPDAPRDLAASLAAEFDLRPAAILERLDLARPIYYPTAAWGHFGRTDVGFPWEATER